jgi:hypothetical protein
MAWWWMRRHGCGEDVANVIAGAAGGGGARTEAGATGVGRGGDAWAGVGGGMV